ncbi:alpha-mannosidase [Paenibacillaceae bacterium]|nr:alpha-mannosidase [Paenibacillaceae bacterium]
MTSKHIYVLSHTHWDREWYLPYETHHVRLIELMDTLLDLLEKDDEFRSFHLDGQTIILDDYLQVRPEMRDRVTQHIQAGRLIIGPWYILQDEFLTSNEANVRNLQIGHRDAAAFGPVCKIGYFPDSFGNMGQAPQLMRQAGIDNAIFGRGVKPVGFNNDVTVGEFESTFSEMIWESPDGSSVLGILFANWYHNGMEVPVDPEQAKEYWNNRIASAERFASTSHLLFMNGCDHQPVQTDLSAALATARELFPDYSFKHTSFPEYIEQVKAALPNNLSVVRGELRSQRTEGWYTLVNTASARVYIKQANQLGQAMLEKVAEPLAAIAATLGKAYPHHLFTYAWKTLMQNHPHDSICGCSIDEVHQEMMTRFAKSRHVAEEIAASSLKAAASQIDTAAAFAAIAPDALPFTVWNTSGWQRSGVVSVDVEVHRHPLDQGAALHANYQALALEGAAVINHLGEPVAAQIEDLGLLFKYDLPEDRFRQPYWSHTVRITLLARDIPALGYACYGLWLSAAVEAAAAAASPEAGTPASSNAVAELPDRVMENELVKLVIADDGTYDLLDKRNGRTYRGLGGYENVGDIGNEYIFFQPVQTAALTTHGLPAAITRLEHSALRTVYEIVHQWEVPASADETLQQEVNQMVSFQHRKAGRSQATVLLTIRTRLTLEPGSAQVKVETELDNRAQDHRIRALFPTDVQSDVHYVDSIFEVAVRDTVPAAEWVNPSNCQHQQAFVNVSDKQGGLTIANLGLNEYEVLRDGRNTIALTLLRAVGELGDWGVFPTPEAQCLGEHRFVYSILPHADEADRHHSFIAAYQEQIPWSTLQVAKQSGSLGASHSFLNWSGDGLALSAFKIADDTNDLVARWFNMGSDETELSVQTAASVHNWHKSTVLEQRTDQLLPEGKLAVRGAEIVTIVGSINQS